MMSGEKQQALPKDAEQGHVELWQRGDDGVRVGAPHNSPA